MQENKDFNKNYKKIKVYVSGYGPFMGITNNPSQELVEYIINNKELIYSELNKQCEIVHDSIYQVSVDYVCENVGTCHNIIQGCLNCGDQDDQKELHLVIHFGINSCAGAIHLECKAKNYIEDYVKHQGKICQDGDDEIFCKLDLEGIIQDLDTNLHKVKISNDAGTYLCNYIYYKSSEKFSKCENVIPLFIHIPNPEVCSREECYRLFVDLLKVVSSKYI